MDFKTNTINTIRILEISGNFDVYTAAPIREWIEQAAGESPSKIVVDLAGVQFIDLTALAVLVQGMKRSRERKGDFRLCGLQQPVRMVLELTRLDRVFEIYPNQNEAIIGFEN